MKKNIQPTNKRMPSTAFTLLISTILLLTSAINAQNVVITSVPPDHTIDCAFNADPELHLFDATTNCMQGGVALSVGNAMVNGTPNCPGTTIQYTYTAQDQCGGVATHTQTFTLQNEGPIFVCPPDVCIMDCPSDAAQLQATFDAFAQLATVLTSCSGDISISNSFDPNGFFNQNCNAGPLNGVDNVKQWQTVTFTATDQCGRTSTCTALAVIVDNEPPVITGNLEVTIRECDDISQDQYNKWINDVINNILTATDNCGGVTWTYSPLEPNIICDALGYAITEVFFTATDDCGNSTTVETHFKLKNAHGPNLSPLPEKTVECDQVPPLPFDTPTVTNSCGPPDLTFLDETIPGSCPQEMMVIRTWTVTDQCDGMTTATQKINVVDTTPPVPPAPPGDIDIECSIIIDPGPLTAVDNCEGDITVFPDDEFIPGSCPNQFTIIRTWTFTDQCGNSSNVSQTINVDDTTPPLPPTPPADITAQCALVIPAPVDLTATDNCDGDITVSPTDVVTPGECVNKFTIVRTWVFTDQCGNSSSVSQTISVNDDTPPVPPPPPADENAECILDVVLFELTALDNCDGPITVFPTVETTPGTCDNQFTAVLTWTFTDQCGNSSSVSQNINVNDTTPPVPPAPPMDLNLQCESEVPAPVDLTAFDFCEGDITVSPTEVTTPGNCDDQFTLVRTWVFSDLCGNTSSVSQTIIVNDNTPPTWNEPDGFFDGTFKCGTDISIDPVVFTLPAPTATDNCNSATVTLIFDDTLNFVCPDNYTRRLTYQGEDECGNVIMTNYVINLVIFNDMPPTWVTPVGSLDSMFMSAAELVIPPPPVAIGQCGPATVDLISMDTTGMMTCPDDFTITLTYIATDNCGLMSVPFIVTLKVLDETPPEFPEPPGSLDDMFDCADDVIITPPVPIDNSGNVTIMIVGDDTISFTCVNQYVRQLSWQAVDSCGNVSDDLFMATIEVNDQTPPEIIQCPVPFSTTTDPFIPQFDTLECFGLFTDLVFSGDDNCGMVNIYYTRSDMPGMIFPGGNANGEYPIGITTIEFFIDDGCLMDSCEVQREVTDEAAPDLICGEVFISLDSPMDLDTVLATDLVTGAKDCSNPVSIEYDSGHPDSMFFSCADLGPNLITVIPVVIVAIDIFGNDNSCNTQINIFNNGCFGAPLGNVGTIIGQINTENGDPFNDVTVHLVGPQETVTTNMTDGFFAFPEVPLSENYTVTPEFNLEPLNGVNTLDLVLIAQHILAIESLDSPYKMIAADVNQSGNISITDIYELTKLILFMDTEFQENTSWRFVDANYVFSDPVNPFSNTFPESYFINSLSDNMLGVDFTAIKTGDVNNSNDINNLTGSGDTRDVQPLTLRIENQLLETGQQYIIDFKADAFEQLYGYQFVLDINDQYAEVLEIAGMSTRLNLSPGNFNKINNNLLATNSYNFHPVNLVEGETVFSIKIMAKTEVTLDKIFQIAADKMKPEVYNSQQETGEVRLEIESTEAGEEFVFELLQNRPNPFKDQTIIPFTLPEKTDIIFTVSDVSGNVIKRVTGSYEKGYHEIMVSGNELPINGIYFYQLISSENEAIRKMIFDDKK